MYGIPDEYKQHLTKDFLTLFKQNVDKIFKITCEAYYEFYVFVESTGGWSIALNQTCRELGQQQLSKYYNSLDEYDSSIFSDQLAALMLEYEIVRESKTGNTSTL